MRHWHWHCCRRLPQLTFLLSYSYSYFLTFLPGFSSFLLIPACPMVQPYVFYLFFLPALFTSFYADGWLMISLDLTWPDIHTYYTYHTPLNPSLFLPWLAFLVSPRYWSIIHVIPYFSFPALGLCFFYFLLGHRYLEALFSRYLRHRNFLFFSSSFPFPRSLHCAFRLFGVVSLLFPVPLPLLIIYVHDPYTTLHYYIFQKIVLFLFFSFFVLHKKISLPAYLLFVCLSTLPCLTLVRFGSVSARFALPWPTLLGIFSALLHPDLIECLDREQANAKNKHKKSCPRFSQKAERERKKHRLSRWFLLLLSYYLSWFGWRFSFNYYLLDLLSFCLVISVSLHGDGGGLN